MFVIVSAPDLDLTLIKLQFDELIDQNIFAKLNGDVDAIIKTLTKNPNYNEILII